MKTLTVKGQATRARIASVAAELMLINGVGGTSMEDVQKAARVSTSQLYHYFGDKHGLVLAVVEHQSEVVLGIQHSFLDGLDSFEAMQEWRDGMVDYQRARHCVGGCPIGSLASELSESDPAARADLAIGYTRWDEAIKAGLSAMKAQGKLSDAAEVDQLATALLAAIQGGLLLSQVRRDTAPLEAALDTMIAHIKSFAA
ncbi:transcriptional regulator, TetR family [Renibacterium salmoninarum ATCC 33209]|uniref:Transcriptional regulator, TetR family n=1 Tax=Renibacterium salmoninarum (strain ATCC 33209 / DSM 20767 / JCM 11484 / NBRC 15589 / NCIMB 2235) TaxID=288705 RepID=A9WQ29_RENSM|nr:TetR/AcrR family transcriptional regulator [Renibacterium salmoninarum]ABY22455.1 transcriptional regulator, TetR family [Renibacterium salmoninarum ATCC 33209]